MKRFALTHRAIRMRYEAQREIDQSFSYSKMGDMFNVGKQIAYRWCRVILDENGREILDHRSSLPNNKRRKKAVMDWINDGVLHSKIQKGAV